MPTNGRHPTRQRPEGNLSRDISRAMVTLLKHYIGRGASHARAYIHGDLVVVVLHGTMTKAEWTLADEGEAAVVRDMRQVLKGKFREDANRIVERLTGQRVSAFLCRAPGEIGSGRARSRRNSRRGLRRQGSECRSPDIWAHSALGSPAFPGDPHEPSPPAALPGERLT